jgi:rhodanese-related sulfurtransferase
MYKANIVALLLILSFTNVVMAEEEKGSKKVFISPGVYSIEVMHKGEKVTIKRNQDRKNTISKYYQPTHRGKIQPMRPFSPHAVETIGALELIDYLQQLEEKGDSLIIIDSRTKAWVKRGTIPGTVNIPFTEFKEDDRAVEIMEEHFDVLSTGSALNFSNAKTLVMYCNGIWCGQSPTAIKKLLNYGYPASKIKYFRGGMQNWESLGLTVVDP